MIIFNMKHIPIFDIDMCFRCLSWRRLFEQPDEMYRWINFHLSSLEGKRSREIALLSIYASRRLCSLYKQNGLMFVARYLKTCRMSLYNALGSRADAPPHSLVRSVAFAPSSKSPLVSLTRAGLPYFILPRHRMMMRPGSLEEHRWIRIYVTLFSFYRLMTMKAKIDVSSILDPSDRVLIMPGGPLSNPALWLHKADKDIVSLPLNLGFGDKLLWSSGPNTSQGLGSLSAIPDDAQALLERLIPFEIRMLDVLFVPSINFLPATGAIPVEEPRGGHLLRFLCQVVASSRPPLNLCVGKVGLKLEAAGKSRLFMILDSISQRLLQPLHEWLFQVLRRIPQDGTFNQLKPLSKLVGRKFHSFDLRSATDRMPAELCAQLLETLWGGAVAASWRSLLYREFVVPPSMKVEPPVDKVTFVTGTPLGSLSSWAAFTLLHHLIVQHAAYLVSRKKHGWFAKYAILGDDLVIGHVKVARQYKRILKWFGVDISLEKSLISENGSMEFASRFIYRGVDLSPCSFKLLASARSSSSQLWSFFRRVSEFRPIKWSEFVRVSGGGYRVMGKIGVSYGTAHRLPKKWFRLWLLVHSPKAPGGLPWIWWLSVGRGFIVPPEAIGLLNHELWEHWSKQFESDGWTLSDSVLSQEYAYKEQVLYRPWVTLYLNSLSRTLLRIMDGELIDPYLDWVVIKRDFLRSSEFKVSSATAKRWSTCYRLYDRMTRILHASLPKALGP